MLTTLSYPLPLSVRILSNVAAPLPAKILEDLYRARTGLLIPENWKGADVLIPVRTVGSSPSTSDYSVVLVQFKNREGCGRSGIGNMDAVE